MNFVRLSIVVLIVCGLASLASGQTLDEKLGQRVDAFDSESKSIPGRLIEVAERNGRFSDSLNQSLITLLFSLPDLNAHLVS